MSRFSAILTLADLGTEGDVLLRSADGGFLGGHGDGIWRLLGWWSRDRWSRRRKEEVERLAMPRAAGRQNWKVRCRLPPRLVLSRCLALPIPPRKESEHRRFSFETLFKAANFRFFSPICSSHSPSPFTPRNTTTQRAPLHPCDSWLSIVFVCAERDAHDLQSWATPWWASSEWVIWARCTPGGSPTPAGGRCKVSPESACTVWICIWYVAPQQNPPRILMT